MYMGKRVRWLEEECHWWGEGGGCSQEGGRGGNHLAGGKPQTLQAAKFFKVFRVRVKELLEPVRAVIPMGCRVELPLFAATAAASKQAPT